MKVKVTPQKMNVDAAIELFLMTEPFSPSENLLYEAGKILAKAVKKLQSDLSKAREEGRREAIEQAIKQVIKFAVKGPKYYGMAIRQLDAMLEKDDSK